MLFPGICRLVLRFGLLQLIDRIYFKQAIHRKHNALDWTPNDDDPAPVLPDNGSEQLAEDGFNAREWGFARNESITPRLCDRGTPNSDFVRSSWYVCIDRSLVRGHHVFRTVCIENLPLQ